MKNKTINTIRVERARFNISQGELGRIVGCTKQQISNIETGKSQLHLPLAMKISKHFNMSVEQLFTLI